ncbi:MAG: serine/threonine protein kinase [Planctomycetales bacterium]
MTPRMTSTDGENSRHTSPLRRSMRESAEPERSSAEHPGRGSRNAVIEDGDDLQPDPSAACRAPADQHEAGGTTIGRFRVERVLGEGTMGTVYLAYDPRLSRRVALKVPKLSHRTKRSDLERFFREARAAAGLRSPNLCPIYDVGEENGTPYISMAYIEGEPLSALLRSPGRLTERTLATLIEKLALALHTAHEQRVIHRDLKPDNIVIDADGEPILMDFGLARQLDSKDPRLTPIDEVVGSPAYMSPEQARGDGSPIGPESDVFSLGVILYELLTGELPFQGSALSILDKIAHQDPKPIHPLRSCLVGSPLAAICLKMLAKPKHSRYRTMREVAAACRTILDSHATPVASSFCLTDNKWKAATGALLVTAASALGTLWLAGQASDRGLGTDQVSERDLGTGQVSDRGLGIGSRAEPDASPSAATVVGTSNPAATTVVGTSNSAATASAAVIGAPHSGSKNFWSGRGVDFGSGNGNEPPSWGRYPPPPPPPPPHPPHLVHGLLHLFGIEPPPPPPEGACSHRHHGAEGKRPKPPAWFPAPPRKTDARRSNDARESTPDNHASPN